MKKNLRPVLGYFFTVWLVLHFVFPFQAKADSKVQRLILAKKYTEAETYCSQLKGEKRINGYRLLGDAYFNEKKLDNACTAYHNGGHFGDVDKIANIYLDRKEFKKAGECFKKSSVSEKRAAMFERLSADVFLKGDSDTAKQFIDYAVSDCETMLKSFDFQKKDSYISLLKRLLEKQKRFPKTEEEKEQQAFLKKVLDGSATYCQKMKKWSFHFFCKEELKEYRDYSKEVIKDFKRGAFGKPERVYQRPTKNTLLYEYQLIQDKNKVSETRTLLKQNGVKKNKKNASLSTHGYRYTRLIFGPLAMFSSSWHKHFYYKILRKETLWNQPAVVVEILPLHKYKRNPLYGTAWVSLKDYSVLRIQWHPASLPLAKTIAKRAKAYKSTPEVTFFADFNIFKRGIRFPSKYYLEESYINKKKKKFRRLKQEVTLKDYMFFVVGTEVIKAEGEGV